MKLLYGTGNQAKLAAMRSRLRQIGIELVGLNDLKADGLDIPKVVENGNTPLENARLKAKGYYEAFHIPVFSCDSGLYFDNVPDEIQPGVHVRNVNGKRLSDDEMIDYYSGLVKIYGNLVARYKNAICFVMDDTHMYEAMEPSMESDRYNQEELRKYTKEFLKNYYENNKVPLKQSACRYLINVAVSRAKKKLMLVVTGNEQSRERNITELIDYIQYNNFEVTESKIYSIFDYLYKQYTEERRVYLQKHKKVSEYDSENLMYSLIEDIISANKYSSLDVVCHFPLNMLIKNPELLNEQECQYAMNPATHLDFLIYNRIGKKPVLAIEVDGYEYHKEDTVQASRDLLKNHIMELYEVPLLRFMTNGSGEKEKIIEMLDKLVG